MSYADVVSRVDTLEAILQPQPAAPVAAAATPASGFGATLAQAQAQGGAAAPTTAKAPNDLQALIAQAGARYGIDPKLIQAVIDQESGGDPNATSPAGAEGLMQLMPDTASALKVANPYDPAQAIVGGTALLAQLLTRYHGNTSLALAAYNAGPSAVDAAGGVPAIPETQAYVKDVLARYAALKAGAPPGASPADSGARPAVAEGASKRAKLDPADPSAAGPAGPALAESIDPQPVSVTVPPVAHETAAQPAHHGTPEPSAVQPATAPSPSSTPARNDGIRLRTRVEGVRRTVATTIRIAVRRHETHARIQLDPPQLGRIDVRLRYGKDAGVSIELRTSSAEATQALGQAVGELKQSLEAGGLHVADIGVRAGTDEAARERSRDLPQDTHRPGPQATDDYDQEADDAVLDHELGLVDVLA